MIKISHLSKKFGNLEVLKDINLDASKEGTFSGTGWSDDTYNFSFLDIKVDIF